MNQTWSLKRFWGNLPLLALVLTGLGLVGLTVFQFFQRQQAAHIAQSAKGTVIDFKEECFEEHCGDAPIVRFTTPAGEMIQFTSQVSSSPRAYRVGDSVDVLYDPQTPQNAEISGAGYGSILMKGIAGLFLAVMGVLLLNSDG
jgi:hypothetical protein